MKKCLILLMAIYLLGLTGCLPNLKPRTPAISFAQDNIRIKILNSGFERAESHLTYIEINEVGASDSAKPQSQYSVRVPVIHRWDSWTSEVIPFSSFSARPGINLQTLTQANVVIRVDAKDMVEETKETDNVYDANH